MESLNKLWAGNFYGTNTGKLFMELVDTAPVVTGRIRLRDDNFGAYIYQIRGQFDDVLELVGTPEEASSPDLQMGSLSIKAYLTAEGNLRGTWHSTLNTAGTFEAYPHDINNPNIIPRSNPDGVPEQIFSQSAAIGAVRLYADDVCQLLSQIKEDFTAARVIATYNLRGSQVVRYADQFVAEFSSLGRLDYLKLNIQELEAHGINRSVLVELTAFGTSEVRVQGIRESWVKGKTDVLAKAIREKQSGLLTAFRRYGLFLNQLFIFGMLVAMFELPNMPSRAAFAACVLILTICLYQVHARLIPGTTIMLGTYKPSAFSRWWPSLVSWASGIASAVIASYVFYLLTKG